MKSAIQKEKDIFNERMESLKNKTTEVVKEMSNQGLNIFQKIDSFIAYSYSKELDAMEIMGNLIREKIESEQKIQLEI